MKYGVSTYILHRRLKVREELLTLYLLRPEPQVDELSQNEAYLVAFLSSLMIWKRRKVEPTKKRLDPARCSQFPTEHLTHL